MTCRKLLLPILCFISFYTSAQNFGGNPAALKWQQVNTAFSRVIFPKGLDSQANRISNIVRLLDSTTTSTIGNRHRKWNIVLLNQTTIPNAYVRLAPVISELNLLPGQDNFSNGSVRWDDNLIIHEDRHMQQLANFNNGLTKAFSFFLGQEGQLFANGITIPDYFFEGDAVWQETLVSAQGRGRMPFFYNGLRSLQLSNKNYSWMKLRSGSLVDYTPDHYELGYQLVAYGYEKYGADFWRKVTDDAVRFKGLFYPFNKAIERYSGRNYSQFRQDALDYFKIQTTPKLKAEPELSYLTPVKKNTVADYQFPVSINNDSILVTKRSYKEINAFYLIAHGREQKISVKKIVIDDYFSYNNGRVVYASYQTDPRWGNRNYSNIELLNIYTKEKRRLTFKSKYFSPVINKEGTEILAVNVEVNGGNNLHRIDGHSGKLVHIIPNPHNYFFTQSSYIDNNAAISAVRNPAGEMALVQVNLTTGETATVTPFSFNVVGFPFVKNDTVYYSAMDNQSPADKIFAVSLKDKKIYRLTANVNGVYQPAVSPNGNLIFSAFTVNGYRLSSLAAGEIKWQLEDNSAITPVKEIGTAYSLKGQGAGALYQASNEKNPVSKYRKSFHLFNFHSWRPFVSDPEYGYSFYSDNILSSFTNTLTYTYNRNDRSHTLGFDAIYAGWFPYLDLGTSASFDRQVDTALGKTVHFNSAKINAGFYIPLSFTGGTTSKYLNFGASYNVEQLYYRGIGKNILANAGVNYASAFLSFSNVSQQALQQINPRWAQSVSLSYRDAFNYRNSHKLVASASLYLPGLSTNHSLVIAGAFQKRDTLNDLFSNNFPYSRGYDALSQPTMYKAGINYHFPLFYPDWGFGNMVFFQRIRMNVFYDHTSVSAKADDGSTGYLKNRSTGAELYFDTKLWNALPAIFEIRFSHLLDPNYRNPTVKNRWEIVIPISLIPN
ncbi:DPP IV N-terminal domain-containing protein [Ferruginibacter paludis]|uniref:DPP IV N-terminal domain-containing protein n=1 Tax=Ferruginibacter paludis TaxID=1310417 RepID=UPI0025B44A68|nr:DPP IV N-terminal domain-containing protein [Ferruginibacter paludis]MDN3656444.1 DPP IV N-terminal domain-containing protein [Ferruginibacter paludis]